MCCSVLSQDDEVAEAVAELEKMEVSMKMEMEMDHLPYLNSTTFYSATQNQHQIVMVLFYVTCEEEILFLVFLCDSFECVICCLTPSGNRAFKLLGSFSGTWKVRKSGISP